MGQKFFYIGKPLGSLSEAREEIENGNDVWVHDEELLFKLNNELLQDCEGAGFSIGVHVNILSNLRKYKNGNKIDLSGGNWYFFNEEDIDSTLKVRDTYEFWEYFKRFKQDDK